MDFTSDAAAERYAALVRVAGSVIVGLDFHVARQTPEPSAVRTLLKS